MATDHLIIADILANQNQKEVTANAAHNLLDRAMNQHNDMTITGNDTLNVTEMRENQMIILGGTPGAFTLDMFDTNERYMAIYNNTDGICTMQNSASGGSGAPVIQVGQAAIFHYDGTDFVDVLTLFLSAYSIKTLELNLGTLRKIASNDIDTDTNHGGILTLTGTIRYRRENGATDKALKVQWDNTDVTEVQFPPVFMPPDLDEGVDVTIHLVAKMSGGTDTTTAFDVQVFDALGDTEMGGLTADMTSSLTELTVTIANANISGHPLGFFNIALVPEAHGTDHVELYAAWIEYTRKPI